MSFSRLLSASNAVRVLAAASAIVLACSPGDNGADDLPNEPVAAERAALVTCDLSAPFGPVEPAFTGVTIANGITLSQDGRTAYVSAKLGPSSNYDVYVATRTSTAVEFGAVLTPVNSLSSVVDDRVGSLSPDGSKFFLAKIGPSGKYDLAAATFNTTTQAFDPPQLLSALNTSLHEQDPFFLPINGGQLYFSAETPPSEIRELYVSPASDGYSTKQMLFSHPAEDWRPVLTTDAQRLYFASSRATIARDGEGDIWTMTRNPTTGAFVDPVDLVDLYVFSSPKADYPVALADGGCTLYIASNRYTRNDADYQLFKATRGSSTPATVTTTVRILGTGSITTAPFQCSTNCSAQGAPGSQLHVWGTSQALWGGACVPDGNNPSTDGFVIFSQGGVCTVDFRGLCGSGRNIPRDDDNPCTTDTCDLAQGVFHEPLPGTACTTSAGALGTCSAFGVCVNHCSSCNDGNPCNGEETCDGAGQCVAGAPPVLSDGNPCTTDTCTPSGGVTHTLNEGCTIAARCATSGDCSNGDVCGRGNGQRLGFDDLEDYCWPGDSCLDDPVSAGCGEPGSPCGECQCVPNCGTKTCGDAPEDGCGGYCRGICQIAEEGCTSNEQCPYGAVCDDGRCVSTNLDPPFDGIPNDTVLPSQSAGVIPGSGSVTPDGAYRYSIPLRVAPGRAGLQPELSLEYNSRGGNGLLGVGWSLAGLSQITRCNKTLATHGTIRGVEMTVDPGIIGPGSESFCLDGARLRFVDIPEPGGYQYRTEHDRFARIIRRVDGACESWEVFERSGMIRRYRAGPGARSLLDVNVTCPVSTWQLSSIEDRAGNRVEYDYEDDVNYANARIQRIRYTSDVNGNGANREVAFTYEAREDVIAGFVSGEERTVPTKLSRIDMFAPRESGGNAEPLWHYQLTYAGSTNTYAGSINTRRSLIDKVEWCDANDVCLLPTTFEWGYGQAVDESAPQYPSELRVRWTSEEIPAGHIDPREWMRVSLADLNGDGLDDLIYNMTKLGRADTQPDLMVRLNEGNYGNGGFGFANPIEVTGIFHSSTPSASWLPYYPHTAQFADLDNDGAMEMLVAGRFVGKSSADGSPVYGALRWDSNQNTFVFVGAPIADPLGGGTVEPPYPLVIADFNGNGILDLFQRRKLATSQFSPWHHVPDLFRLAECQGVGNELCFNDPSVAAYDTGLEWWWQSLSSPIDLDGDGTSEMLQFRHDAGDVVAWEDPSAGNPSDAERLPSLVAGLADLGRHILTFADVNGDGLKDAIDLAFDIRINTGRSFLPEYRGIPDEESVLARMAEITNTNEEIRSSVRVADFNRDGFDDLLVLHSDDYVPLGSANYFYRTGPLLFYSDGAVFHEVPLTGGGLNRSVRIGGGPEGYPPHLWASSAVGDVNGDGYPDLVSLVTNGATSPGSLSTHIEVASFAKTLGSGGTTVPPDVITLVNNGLVPDASGWEQESISYASASARVSQRGVPLDSNWTSKPVHERGTSCAYPQRCMTRGMLLVNQYVPRDSGHFQYTYRDGRFDSLGRGFLGFAEVEVVDISGGQRWPITGSTTTRYDLDTRIPYGDQTERLYYYPFLGLPVEVETRRSLELGPTEGPRDDARLVRTRYLYEAVPGGDEFSFVTRPKTGTACNSGEGSCPGRIVQEFNDFEGSRPPFRTTTTTFEEWDNFGNLKRQSISVEGGDRTDIESTYDNREDVWLLGLLREQRVTSTTHERGPDSPTHSSSRTRSYDYDARGLLRSETVEPNTTDPDLRLDTTYVRNAEGLVERIDARGATGGLRVTSIDYDADGTFPHRIENALGHVTWIGYHPGLGAPAIGSDPNDILTEWKYDGFGRSRGIVPQGGIATSVDYSVDFDQAITGRGVFAVDATSADGRASKRRYSASGLELLRSERSFNGSWYHRQFEYLERMPVKASLPFEDGETPLFVQIEYDAFLRLRAVTRPDRESTFVTSQLVYRPTPFETVTVDGEGHATRQILDLNGRPLQTRNGQADISDPAPEFSAGSGRASFTYRPFGTLHSVARDDDEVSIVRGFEHDALGRLIKVTDDDAGTTRTRYNSFGDIRESEDALERISIHAVDPLGRTLNTDSPDGITGFVWDRDRLGALSEAHSPDGVATFLDYDAFGRLEEKELRLEGNSYTLDFRYDNLGRVRRVDYPKADSAVDRFIVRQHYNANGFLECIVDGRNSSADDCTGPELHYWTATQGTPYFEEEVVGNGLTTSRFFDPTTLRLDRILVAGSGPATEDTAYTYYDNDEVKTRTNAATGITDTYVYDGHGRLEQWDRGDRREVYDYDQYDRIDFVRTTSPATTSPVVTDYDYSSIQGDRRQAPMKIGDLEFDYDRLGRRWQKRSGDVVLETIEYTSFDLPKRISGPSGDIATLSYNAFAQRAKKTSPAGTTIYMDELFERRTSPGGDKESIFHVYAGSRPIAQVTFNPQTEDETVRYLHADIQGSVTTITRENGSVSQRNHYAPFGQRINEDGSPLQNVNSGGIHFGYTSHEHDDELSLINMRGRLYDPVGRTFLTPDPVVASIFDGPSHNPYTYVRNNPIGFTDPSGFCWHIINCPPTRSPTKDAGSAPSPAPAPAVSAPAPPPPAPSPAPAQPTKADAKEVVEARAAAVANAHRESVKQSGGSSASSGDTPPDIVSTSPVVNYVLNEPLSTFNVVPGFQLPPISFQDIAASNVSNVCGFMGCGAANAPTDTSEREPALDDAQKIARSVIAAAGVLSGAKGAAALLERAAARGSLGVGGNIRHVNPTGGTMNCANCAVATDATLAGSAASALPGGVTSAAQLAKELGGTWLRTNGPSGIAQTMQAAGPGARGIVFGTRGSGIGHFFNVTNQRGVVRFLDGQSGGAANLAAGYDGFWLLRTF